MSDTRFLLETLFHERKALLRVCLKYGLPGFSKVLVILWQLAISQSDKLFWERLDALQHRNYIVSPKEDRVLTRTFSKPFYIRRGRCRVASSNCADDEDAENLLEAFRRNLDLVQPEDASVSLLWISGAVIPDGATAGRYTPTLINIARDLTAIMIRKHSSHESGVEEWDVMQLGVTMTRSMGAYFRELARSRRLSYALVEQTMTESQVLGLGGQVYLRGMGHELATRNALVKTTQVAASERQQILEAFNSTMQGVQEIASFTKSLAAAAESSHTTLALAYLDWSRIQTQTEFLLALSNIKPETYKSYYEPWVQIGRTLGFELWSLRKCAYSRCFNDLPMPYSWLRVCGSCRDAYYCSRACQYA
ncbi:hypothetical protein FRC08_006607 [Ceratobasidium sp. 394]|nr:hypothetical protein FRC08_006607 [Ceratobasidium sp. 394]